MLFWVAIVLIALLPSISDSRLILRLRLTNQFACVRKSTFVFTFTPSLLYADTRRVRPQWCLLSRRFIVTLALAVAVGLFPSDSQTQTWRLESQSHEGEGDTDNWYANAPNPNPNEFELERDRSIDHIDIAICQNEILSAHKRYRLQSHMPAASCLWAPICMWKEAMLQAPAAALWLRW